MYSVDRNDILVMCSSDVLYTDHHMRNEFIWRKG